MGIENDLLFVRQGTFVEEMVGWQDYNDLATQSAPIQLSVADQWYVLPNDGLGPFTNTKYRVLGKPDIWDPSTNSFNFSDLFLGGLQILRTSGRILTGGSNVEVEARLHMAIGSGAEYFLPISQRFLNRNNTEYLVGTTTFFTIDNEQTRDFPAQVQVRASVGGCEVTVDGWKIMTLDRF